MLPPHRGLVPWASSRGSGARFVRRKGERRPTDEALGQRRNMCTYLRSERQQRKETRVLWTLLPGCRGLNGAKQFRGFQPRTPSSSRATIRAQQLEQRKKSGQPRLWSHWMMHCRPGPRLKICTAIVLLDFFSGLRRLVEVQGAGMMEPFAW